MGLEIRREADGTVAFVCSRGGPTAEDRHRQWIIDEALRQRRCPLCMAPLRPGGCGVETGECSRPPATPAQAVAVLRGRVTDDVVSGRL